MGGVYGVFPSSRQIYLLPTHTQTSLGLDQRTHGYSQTPADGIVLRYQRDGWASLGDLGSNSIEHSLPRREDAQGGPGAPIDHGVTVDQHFELSVLPLLHFDFGVQFATNPRRHPDGV